MYYLLGNLYQGILKAIKNLNTLYEEIVYIGLNSNVLYFFLGFEIFEISDFNVS